MSQSSEVFINKSKSRRTAARNLSKGNQKTCPFGIKVKPKKLLYFPSSRQGLIFHVSHRSKIRLRHTVFFENENPHEFYNHCWDRKTLELFTKLPFWKIISDFSALYKVFG